MSRSYNLGQFEAPVDAALADMAQRRLLARMWKKDYRVWKPTPTEIRPGDYFAVLAYLRPSAKIDAALKAFRRRMVTRYRMATTAGHGPRYLHSTGQLHKGGPSQGMFLELTEPPSRDLKIPGAPYTFGTLAQAQAVGDVQSLQTHGRPVVHLALGLQPALQIQALLASTTQRGSRNAKRAQPKRERSRGRRA